MTTEEKFLAAVNVIKSLPKDGPFQPSYDLTLKFQAYYRQATEGPCKTPKPSFFDRKKYEWHAWKALGDMPKEVAMEKYIEQLSKVIETMSYTETVSKFIDLMGPFYEIVWPEDTSAESGEDSRNRKVPGATHCDKNETQHSVSGSVIQESIPENVQEPFEVISHQSLMTETLSVEQIEVTYHPDHNVIHDVSGRGNRNPILGAVHMSDVSQFTSSESSIPASDVLPMFLNLQKSLDKILEHIKKLEVLVRTNDIRVAKETRARREDSEAKGRTITPFTLFLVVVWPFVVHWVVNMVRRRNACRIQ